MKGRGEGTCRFARKSFGEMLVVLRAGAVVVTGMQQQQQQQQQKKEEEARFQASRLSQAHATRRAVSRDETAVHLQQLGIQRLVLSLDCHLLVSFGAQPLLGQLKEIQHLFHGSGVTTLSTLSSTFVHLWLRV